MATIVCQGLQSCLESSHLVEPRTLRLKLSSSSPPQFPQQTHELSSSMKSNTKEFSEKNKQIIMNNQNSNKNTEKVSGGWSFLQALSNTSHQTVPKEPIYVHPLVKRSSSSLSEKSLKLCTENLGNETGTDMMMMMMLTVENNAVSVVVGSEELSEDLCRKGVGSDYLPRNEEQSKVMMKKQSIGQSLVAEEIKAAAAKGRDFPPPLTTIRGGDSLRVSPQRENGRLIIKAVKAPSNKSCFQADRSNGRLRLCLVENLDTRFDSETERDSIDYGEEIDGKEDDENDSKIEEEEEEEEEVEVEVEDFGEEIRKRDGYDEEVGMDGNCVKGGGEIGILENYGRPSCRCKEGSEQEKNKTVVLNWEPVWVTS